MKKLYEWVSFDSAINLLRPRAKWRIDHGKFDWQDPRPCPTMEQIEDVLNKIKDFEESIDYILLEEQEEAEPDPCQDPKFIAWNYDCDLKERGVNSGGGNVQGEGIGGKGGVAPEDLGAYE